MHMPPPERTRRNSSTIAWVLLATAAISIAFAAGQMRVPEVSGMIQMPGTGIDFQKAYNKTAICADEARQVIRAFSLITYLVMALAVIVSSQP
eukprot:4107504-Pleurochrysis_carterae.AAC.1